MMYTVTYHTINTLPVAELISDTILFHDYKDIIEICGSLAYAGYSTIVIQQHHITPDFFDLQNGIAGDIIQKIANYKLHLIIIGDFSHYTRTSIRDFIYECNLHKEINFLGNFEEIKEKLK